MQDCTVSCTVNVAFLAHFNRNDMVYVVIKIRKGLF